MTKPLRIAGTLVAVQAVLALFVPSAHAAISDGANAVDMIGQYTMTDASSLVPAYTHSSINNATVPNRFGFSSARGLAIDTVHHRLFLGEEGNARVLEWDLTAGNVLADHVPDHVLGQPDFGSNTQTVTQTGIVNPESLAYDAVHDRLYVGDGGAQRVMVFDVASIADGEPAVAVLGQPDFTSSSAGAGPAGMHDPYGLEYDAVGGRLFVSDKGNRRVLVWNDASISTGHAADNVLGQPDFSSTGATTTQAGLRDQYSIAIDAVGARLFVGDTFNHRVLVFDVASITDGEPAVAVLGQPDFTSSSSAVTQTGMFHPIDLAYDAARGYLFLANSSGNRVLVYNVAVVTNNEPAIYVLGQPDFTSSGAATTQAGTDHPQYLTYDPDNQRLYVDEANNSRVLVYDAATTTNGEPAADVLGQYEFAGESPLVLNPVYTTGAADNNNGTNRIGLSGSGSVALDEVGHRMFMLDMANNRVMVFNLNADNTLTDKIPDFVLGQANFTDSAAATTQEGLSFSGPELRGGMVYDSARQRLFVADQANCRVMVFNVAAITNGESAENELGQPAGGSAFTTNGSATNQSGMNEPQGMAYDTAGGRLFVSDSANHRVLVFDTASGIADGMDATYVLGQVDFDTADAAVGQTYMINAHDVAYDGARSRLFVGTGAHSVLVFDVSTIDNNEPATHILGQADFDSTDVSYTQSGLVEPQGLAYDSTHSRLFVSDVHVGRVTVFDVASVEDNEPAVNVFGQPDFTSGPSGATTQSRLNAPVGGMAYDAGNQRLYVPDTGNNRVMVYDAAVPSSGGGGQPQPATVTVVQPNGGETLAGGSSYNVVWGSNGSIASYRLSYSTNAGLTWAVSATGITGNSYIWTVPNVSTSQARVRIEAMSSANAVLATDDSNANFSITATGSATPPPPPAPPHTYDFDPNAELSGSQTIDQAMGLVAVANHKCTPGSLIRGSRPTVYYCGIDGKRYAFHNAKVFFSWFPNFNNVQFLTNAQVAAIPLAPGFVQYRPGLRMIKLQTNLNVYAVTRSGIIRLVPDETTALALYGSDWNTKIDDIPEAFFTPYVIGVPIR